MLIQPERAATDKKEAPNELSHWLFGAALQEGDDSFTGRIARFA
jgi:hypothetical protein